MCADKLRHHDTTFLMFLCNRDVFHKIKSVMLKPIKSNKHSETELAKASTFHLPISSNNSEDLTVEDLGISENLSVRSMNACKQEDRKSVV